MPKRSLSDDENPQAIKKQHTYNKSRKIRSLSSERTLQLLYEGAAKNDFESKKEIKQTCVGCTNLKIIETECSFCEHRVCNDCRNVCFKCQGEFCLNCSFPTYDERESVCYSCYR